MKRCTMWTMLLITMSVLLFVTASSGWAQVAGSSVKLGYLLEKSGFGASEGAEEEIAIQMAIEEINKAGGVGGVPLVPVIYDTGSKPDQAISLARKLIHVDKVVAVVGPAFSSLAEVAFPVAVRGKTVMVSQLSTKPGLAAKNRPWAFRNSIAGPVVYDVLVREWVRRNNVKTVAIMYDAKDRFSQSDGTKVFPNLLKKYGVKVIGSVTFTTGDIDFSGQVTKLRSLGPDGIIIAALREEGAHVVREIKKQGMGQPLAGGMEFSTTRFVELAGSAGEGIMTSHSTWMDNPDPSIQEFIKKYTMRSKGVMPSVGAVRAYDTTYMMRDIMVKQGITNRSGDLQKDRDKIREGWATLKDYKGLEGRTSMNQVGDGIKDVYLLRLEGGKYRRIQ
ncbi:MAG: ABC transporter substrate-binding protein [Candidatus Methylomirabilia bacterium]